MTMVEPMAAVQLRAARAVPITQAVQVQLMAVVR